MVKKHRIIYIVGFAGLFLAFFWFFYRSKNLNSKGLRRVLRALQMAFIAALIWISTLLPTFAKTDDPSFGVYGFPPSPSRFWPRKSGQCEKPPSAGRPNPFRPKVNPYCTAPNLVDQGLGAGANPAGAGGGGGAAEFDDQCPVPENQKSQESKTFDYDHRLNDRKKKSEEQCPIYQQKKANIEELPDSSKYIYSLETKTAKKAIKNIWKNPEARQEVLDGLGRMDRGELLPRHEKNFKGFKELKEIKLNDTRMLVKPGQKGAPDEIVIICMRRDLDSVARKLKNKYK